MEQVRARVKERSRRGAAPAEEPERGRGAAADSEPGTGAAALPLPPSASFAFHGNSIYWSSRGRGVGQLLHASRRLLAPLLKFVFNIDPMVDALAIQAKRNVQQAVFDDDMARRLAAREERDTLNRRAVESLTAEMKRLADELTSQRALLESVVERLDALERAGAGERATRPHRDGRDDKGPDAGAPASPIAAETPPPSGTDDHESPDVAGPASPAAARSTPPSDRLTDEREDDDAPAAPPAADTPGPPNR